MDFYFPGWAEGLKQAFDAAESLEALWPKWEAFLLAHQQTDPIPPLIMRAAELIIQRKGVLAIADLAAELGLEKRWRERKFLDF